MGALLGDKDLNKEFGFGSDKPTKERYNLGDPGGHDLNRVFGHDREPANRPDYLGVGRRFDYTAMKPYYRGYLNSGVGTEGRYDGRSTGAGCGSFDTDNVVPDRIGDVDLMNACDSHDLCYGDGELSRFECDWEFGENIFQDCRDAGHNSIFCGVLTELYYEGVRWGGEKSFKGPKQYPGRQQSPR